MPAEVTALQTDATRCDASTRSLQARLPAPDDAGYASARAQLRSERNRCSGLRALAATALANHRNPLQADLTALTQRASSNSQALGAATTRQAQTLAQNAGTIRFHPIAVATVIAQWGWGQDAVLAGLLHDVVEDSHFVLSDIEDGFGPSVAALVAACTKDIRIECKTSRAADLQMRLRLALPELGPELAMLKLVDRAHNLFTSGHLTTVKTRALAEESLRFYGPLAKSLGMQGLASWMGTQPSRSGQAKGFEETLLGFKHEAASDLVKQNFAAGLRSCRNAKRASAVLAHALA